MSPGTIQRNAWSCVMHLTSRAPQLEYSTWLCSFRADGKSRTVATKASKTRDSWNGGAEQSIEEVCICVVWSNFWSIKKGPGPWEMRRHFPATSWMLYQSNQVSPALHLTGWSQGISRTTSCACHVSEAWACHARTVPQPTSPSRQTKYCHAS